MMSLCCVIAILFFFYIFLMSFNQIMLKRKKHLEKSIAPFLTAAFSLLTAIILVLNFIYLSYNVSTDTETLMVILSIALYLLIIISIFNSDTHCEKCGAPSIGHILIKDRKHYYCKRHKSLYIKELTEMNTKDSQSIILLNFDDGYFKGKIMSGPSTVTVRMEEDSSSYKVIIWDETRENLDEPIFNQEFPKNI